MWEAEVRKKVDELASVLLDRHKEIEVRRNAAEELGDLKHPSAIKPLSEVIKRKDWFGAWQASVLALAEIRDPRVTPILVNSLRKVGGGTNQTETIVRALAMTKRAAAIPHLAKVAFNGGSSDRKAALLGLGNFPHRKAVQTLWLTLQDESNPFNTRGVLITAAQSLMRIGKAIGKKPIGEKYFSALQLISPHLHGNESYEVVRAAYGAALNGKISPDNARLYVKQLRAQQGNLK